MTELSRRHLMAGAAGLGLASQLSAPLSPRPSRPPDHAGRALGRRRWTDATARIVGSLMEREFGQPVNVVNRTGGSGVVGHQPSPPARRMATRSAW